MRSRILGGDARSAIGDLQERAADAAQPPVAHLDRRCRGRRQARESTRSGTGSTRSDAAGCRIDAHFHVLVAAVDAAAARAQLQRAAEFLAESLRSTRQREAVRAAVASRRESCSTLSMMPLTRSALVLHDLREPPVLLVQRRGFGQQLRGVAHGADRIADLVGDARRQATEGRELGLLHLGGRSLRCPPGTRSPAPARCCPAARSAAGSRARRRPPQACRQPLRGLARVAGARSSAGTAAVARLRPSSAPGNGTFVAQQLRRGFVDQADAVRSDRTTRMLSRRCCTMYCESCARLARSSSWRRAPAPRSRAGGWRSATPTAPPGTAPRRGCRPADSRRPARCRR